MKRGVCRSLIAFAGLVGAAGCPPQSNTEIMNAPPGREAENQSRVAEYYACHHDQGLMAAMSIADIHFMPNSDQLSGAGKARLERYAELLCDSGGVIAYDTELRDSHVIEMRMAAAREFLASANLNSATQIDVVQGLSNGRGMSARESIAGQAVAKQPEPRGSAYNLEGAGGSASGGGGGS